MTKMPVCKGSAKRRQSIGQFGLALGAVILGATAAQADIWDEFEARCLVPMENVALVQPEDLTPDKSFKNDGDTYSTYRIGDMRLAVSDGRMDRPKWCSVSAHGGTSRELLDRALDWSARVQTEGRYQQIDDRVPTFVLRSTVWREPKIDVTLAGPMKSGILTLRVEETDLEA